MEMTLEQILDTTVNHVARKNIEKRFDEDQSVNAYAEMIRFEGLSNDPEWAAAIEASSKYTPIQQRAYLDNGLARSAGESIEAVYDNSKKAIEGGFRDKDLVALYLLQESKIPVDKFGNDEWAQRYASAKQSHPILKDPENIPPAMKSAFIKFRIQAAQAQGIPSELIQGLEDMYRSTDIADNLIVKQAQVNMKSFTDGLTVEDGRSRILGAYAALGENERKGESLIIADIIGMSYMASQAQARQVAP